MSTQLKSATFVAKGELARHMKTHLESKFGCEKCENVYTRKDNLQKHQLNCGGDCGGIV